MHVGENREFYEHDAGCPQLYEAPNDRGIMRCKGCSALFDAVTEKGVSLTDTRLDENWPERRAAGAGWNDQRPQG